MKLQKIFSDLPQLETERTVLRKVKREDEYELYAICSDEDTARFTTWEKHLTIDDTRRFIAFMKESYAKGWPAPWGIEDKQTGTFLGTCGFINWNARHSRGELASALSKKHWGKGYMTEVVKKIIQFCYSETDLVRVEAHCLSENVGSATVLKKSGLSFEGILRKYYYANGEHRDLKVFSIVRSNSKEEHD